MENKPVIETEIIISLNEAFFAAFQGIEARKDSRVNEVEAKPSGSKYGDLNLMALNVVNPEIGFPLPSDPRFKKAIETIKERFPEITKDRKKGMRALKSHEQQLDQVLLISNFELNGKYYLVGAGLGTVEEREGRFGASEVSILIGFSNSESLSKLTNEIDKCQTSKEKVDKLEAVMKSAFGEKMNQFGATHSYERFRFPYDSNQGVYLKTNFQ